MRQNQLLNDFLKQDEALQKEFGNRLHEKITKVSIYKWQEAFQSLTKEDCIAYIHNLTINRTFDGFIREKSVVNDGLAKIFPHVNFQESPPELDHAGDIDYIGYVGGKAFGIQIKPTTAKANFGNYSVSERMKAGFQAFEADFGGKVFIVFSLDGEIANTEVLDSISEEINRLQKTGNKYH